MKFIKIAIFLISLSGFAQSKVGVVDVEFILSNMPEISSVNENLESYGKQLDVDLNKKVEEYKSLATAYQSGKDSFTDAERLEKQKALLALEDEVQKFQQNGAKLMDIKNTEYLQPLYKKIGDALEKVAKEQGFTQVMQSTVDVVYLDPAYDLTLPILLDMGITLKTEE